MTKNITVPKQSNCDNTIESVLDIVIEQNAVCNALVARQVTADDVILTFDDSVCGKAAPAAGAG